MVDLETHEFVIPKKELCSPADIAGKWEKSEAYRDLLGFITAMNEAVKDVKTSDDVYESEVIQNLVKLLEELDKWIDETPPTEQPQRFGNKAFRVWFDKLKENAESLLLEALGEKYRRALPEVAVYLVEGVGNWTRIDYGTGHEMAFVAFMCCLYKIGVLEEKDAPATILRVFARYLVLVRKLQTTYRMEPAGSQGVSGIDDFQFLVFYWGSAQFLHNTQLKPSTIAESSVCQRYANDYLFYAAVDYINTVKSGPFYEHSNTLWGISAVQLWDKVNRGLMKMYKAEVLSKFPIIQHFLFGSLMSIQPASQ